MTFGTVPRSENTTQKTSRSDDNVSIGSNMSSFFTSVNDDGSPQHDTQPFAQHGLSTTSSTLPPATPTNAGASERKRKMDQLPVEVDEHDSAPKKSKAASAGISKSKVLDVNFLKSYSNVQQKQLGTPSRQEIQATLKILHRNNKHAHTFILVGPEGMMWKISKEKAAAISQVLSDWMDKKHHSNILDLTIFDPVYIDLVVRFIEDRTYNIEKPRLMYVEDAEKRGSCLIPNTVCSTYIHAGVYEIAAFLKIDALQDFSYLMMRETLMNKDPPLLQFIHLARAAFAGGYILDHDQKLQRLLASYGVLWHQIWTESGDEGYYQLLGDRKDYIMMVSRACGEKKNKFSHLGLPLTAEDINTSTDLNDSPNDIEFLQSPYLSHLYDNSTDVPSSGETATPRSSPSVLGGPLFVPGHYPLTPLAYSPSYHSAFSAAATLPSTPSATQFSLKRVH
ncbi:hypothetical protein BDV96DRAFT_670051 [Lophiotrema nucula]|uniref:BTB domain-containing protein n=1 Tax=Lophiotrema nucula TaxID=690887 RepID=A0A6A5YPD2_9PLEO|nr:hypothetical protein BDV96DRAFT_670051 [Lophiotrema nucula]